MWTPPTLFSWVWLFVMTKALFPILVPDVSACGSLTSIILTPTMISREPGIDRVTWAPRNRFWQRRVLRIDSDDFAALILESGLLGNHSAFTWVTFHGAYDIAHLMKILIRQPLPYDLMGFMNLVQRIFGKRLFDLKHMVKFCDGLMGV